MDERPGQEHFQPARRPRRLSVLIARIAFCSIGFCTGFVAAFVLFIGLLGGAGAAGGGDGIEVLLTFAYFLGVAGAIIGAACGYWITPYLIDLS
jgi:hypothetical protein